VFLVMYLFLQNLRATLIPTIAVPVVLLGTFGVLAAFGYSINTLTMFGMVLAIGLLVDDAIVVVENVERVMSEEGLSPREATRKSMDQITGALVGIALVLSAVFVPMAFFGGSTGVIYRQFSITIVSAMVLSVLVALVLTPALCATLLKPAIRHEHAKSAASSAGSTASSTRAGKATARSSRPARARKRCATSRLRGAVAAAWRCCSCAADLLPARRGPGRAVHAGPAAGRRTQERTRGGARAGRTSTSSNEKPDVESLFTVAGFSFGGRGQNAGHRFVKLKDWDERKAPERKVKASPARDGRFSQIRDAHGLRLRAAGRSRARQRDRLRPAAAGPRRPRPRGADRGAQPAARHGAQDPLLAACARTARRTRRSSRSTSTREGRRAGAVAGDINDTLSTAWGGAYVNDFIDRGRVKRVYMQGDAPFRMQPEDLGRWYVRNASGEMVPFSAFASGRWTYGSPRLERLQRLPSSRSRVRPAPGVSSGEAMAAVEEIAAQLPPGIGSSGPAVVQERLAGAQAPRSTRSRCSSCSCASPRCTRAGRSRSR
jgi:multidrug efflux pump